jgi:hypothetical protein
VRARIQDYVRQGGVKPAPGPEKNKFMKGLDVLTGKALPDFGSKSSPATEGYVQRLLCAAVVEDWLGFVGVIASLTVGVIAQCCYRCVECDVCRRLPRSVVWWGRRVVRPASIIWNRRSVMVSSATFTSPYLM